MPFLIPVLLFATAAQPYDIIIRNGHIIDGTGSPWYAADLGIRGGRIASIGNLTAAPARRTIEAKGLVVAPHLPSKIFQGITTEVTGEGGSVAPLNDAIIKADHVTYEHYKIQPTWR